MLDVLGAIVLAAGGIVIAAGVIVLVVLLFSPESRDGRRDRRDPRGRPPMRVNTEEAAEALGVSPDALRRWDRERSADPRTARVRKYWDLEYLLQPDVCEQVQAVDAEDAPVDFTQFLHQKDLDWLAAQDPANWTDDEQKPAVDSDG